MKKLTLLVILGIMLCACEPHKELKAGVYELAPNMYQIIDYHENSVIVDLKSNFKINHNVNYYDENDAILTPEQAANTATVYPVYFITVNDGLYTYTLLFDDRKEASLAVMRNLRELVEATR